jgi:hypothetical protein
LPPENPSEEVAFDDEIYRNQIFDVVADDTALTFISPDGRLRKTFALKDNTIYAHYSTQDPNDVWVGFGLPVNIANMYSGSDWWAKIVKVETAEASGWRIMDGGYAIVNPILIAYSFTDSPVREEMKEREDISTYSYGHWLFFPYNMVKVHGSGEFDVSLTLSAEMPTAIEQAKDKAPIAYQIYQNYPNPFNPETAIEFQLPQPSEIEISIFNLQGQKITTLVNSNLSAGEHKVAWNGTDESGRAVTSGVYLCQMRAGDRVETKKLLLLR